MATLVFETGRPGRIDHYADATGTAVDLARELGFHSAVGAPITVEGRLWGAMSVASTGAKPLPADIEVRLAGFTDLVATASANAQARLELRGHAEERSALRRVATLAARAARTSPSWPGTTRTAYRRPSVRGAAPVPCPSPSAPRRGWAAGT